MTTSSASARPYSVFVDVPVIYSGLVTFKDEATFVDTALAPGQIDSYELLGSRAKIIAACILTSMLAWLFPTMFFLIETMRSLMHRDYVWLAWEAGIVAAVVVAIIVASRYIGRESKAVDAAIADMKGRIADVPKGDRREDLIRIQKALDVLQSEHGTAYDDRAREAVNAVLDQHRHQPDEKHLIIAESTADDADSVAIRARALAAKAAWGQDVARAEHLVLELEDAAAGKLPAAL